MVSQAEKYKRIGISNILENGDEDNINKLAISYNSLTVTLSSSPTLIANDIAVEVENTSSDVITETVILRVDDRRVDDRTVTFNGAEVKTINFSYTFPFGGKEYEVSSGRDGDIVSEKVQLTL